MQHPLLHQIKVATPRQLPSDQLQPQELATIRHQLVVSQQLQQLETTQTLRQRQQALEARLAATQQELSALHQQVAEQAAAAREAWVKEQAPLLAALQAEREGKITRAQDAITTVVEALVALGEEPEAIVAACAAARSSLEDLRGRYHPVTLPGELSVVQGTRIPLGERHKLLGRLHAELEAVAASWGQEDRHRLRSVARMGIG